MAAEPDAPLTARQVIFLRRLEAARRRLLSSFAGLDCAIVCGAPVTGEWSVKDLLAHIIAWNHEFRRDIEAILAGEHPGFLSVIDGSDDFSTWNDQVIAAQRGATWEETLDALDRDYQEAHELILRLVPRDFRKRGVTPWKKAAVDRPALPTAADTESVETLVTYHWRHMHQHARMIEKWRKRLAA